MTKAFLLTLCCAFLAGCSTVTALYPELKVGDRAEAIAIAQSKCQGWEKLVEQGYKWDAYREQNWWYAWLSDTKYYPGYMSVVINAYDGLSEDCVVWGS